MSLLIYRFVCLWAITLLCMLPGYGGFAQAKVWRTIDLKTYPNNVLTNPYFGFRQVLLEAIQQQKLTAYYYSDNFADFSRAYTPKQAQKKISFTEDGPLGEYVYLRPLFFEYIELQESYTFINAQKHRRQVVGLTLICPYGVNQTKVKFLFKYGEVSKYLRKLYKSSRKQKKYELLKAYRQSPIDSARQMSVITALEQQKFRAVISKTKGTTPQQLARLKALPRYNPPPLPDSLTYFKPCFIRVDKHRIRTTLRYQLDLRKPENTPLYLQGKGIVYDIINGVKAKKIQPYIYQYISTLHKYMPISDHDFFEDPANYLPDTSKIKLAKLYKIEVVGWLTMNTKTNERTFEIFALDLLLPKGEAPQAMLGDIHIGLFKYGEIKAYWQRRFKQSNQQKSVWVNPKKPGQKMSFAQAFAQGLYKATTVWFVNRGDYEISFFWYNKKMQQKLRQHVDSYLTAPKKR